ncbi:MAG: efflux RND transporter permease subunit, partial [Opitutales bacterium]|nr:efflux RND transporter permease subunit [Opitutales bacterium]
MGDGMSMGSSSPVNIEIRGDDFSELEKLGEKVTSIVKAVPGTREVSFSMEEGRPEIRLQIKRDKASSYGLTSTQIASAVRTSLSGSVATLYRTNGDEVNVRVEAMAKNKESLEDIKALQISTPFGTKIPLSQVVNFETVKGPTKITRDNQVRSVSIRGDIAGRDLQSVSRDIAEGIKEVVVPSGYTIEFGGEQKEMTEAFMDLALALVLAILLVYMIMAAQFESLMHPFIIMFSIPLALVGAVLGLVITGRTFSVVAFIGLIMLAGIVVNNGIVMVDYINRLRRQGKERKEAILEAGSVRLRPILMTASTTILAMVPLAVNIGEGAEARAPLATVVVGGLAFGAILTLVVIPVVYTFVDDLAGWLKRRLKRVTKTGDAVNS